MVLIWRLDGGRTYHSRQLIYRFIYLASLGLRSITIITCYHNNSFYSPISLWSLFFEITLQTVLKTNFHLFELVASL